MTIIVYYLCTFLVSFCSVSTCTKMYRHIFAMYVRISGMEIAWGPRSHDFGSAWAIFIKIMHYIYSMGPTNLARPHETAALGPRRPRANLVKFHPWDIIVAIDGIWIRRIQHLHTQDEGGIQTRFTRIASSRGIKVQRINPTMWFALSWMWVSKCRSLSRVTHKSFISVTFLGS